MVCSYTHINHWLLPVRDREHNSQVCDQHIQNSDVLVSPNHLSSHLDLAASYSQIQPVHFKRHIHNWMAFRATVRFITSVVTLMVSITQLLDFSGYLWLSIEPMYGDNDYFPCENELENSSDLWQLLLPNFLEFAAKIFINIQRQITSQQ